MAGIPGHKMTDEAKNVLKKYKPGGIILYGYNITSEENTKKFIADLQQVSIENGNLPLFISVDEEGGRVKRFHDGVSAFPGNMALGVADDGKLTYEIARALGIQLRRMGVNMNLSPVVDVNNNPNNPVINTRSFGSNPEVVSRMGVKLIAGLQDSGCIAVAKHFPGHGDTDRDSHLTLPYINHGIERLEKIEFLPFSAAIKSGVECVMTAHISYPNILHSRTPATLCKYFLTELLRGKMIFGGLVITDDMEMQAVSKLMDIGESSVASIIAGADVVLISTCGKSIEKAVNAIKKAIADGRISEQRIDESLKRILFLKVKYNIMTLKEGKIGGGDIIYGKKDLEILSKAEELNKIASRKAVYYKADKNFEPVLQEDILVFYSSSALMQRIIGSAFKNAAVVKNENEFLKYIGNFAGKNKGNTGGLKIFINIDEQKFDEIERLLSAVKDFPKTTLISTGNPFPLLKMSSLPPAIFTFSNTEKHSRLPSPP